VPIVAFFHFVADRKPNSSRSSRLKYPGLCGGNNAAHSVYEWASIRGKRCDLERRTPVYAYSGNPGIDRPVFYLSRRRAGRVLDAGEVVPIVVNGQSVLQKTTPDSRSNTSSAITAWESEINAGVRDGNLALIKAKVHCWKPTKHVR